MAQNNDHDGTLVPSGPLEFFYEKIELELHQSSSWVLQDSDHGLWTGFSNPLVGFQLML